LINKTSIFCGKYGLATIIFSIAEENEVEQKEVTKLLEDVYEGISIENRRRKGSKETSSKAGKELNIPSQEGKTD